MSAPKVVVFDLDDTLFPERAYVRSGFAAVDTRVREWCGCAGFAATAWRLFLAGRRGRIFDETLAELGLPSSPAAIEMLVGVYRDHRPAIALFPDVEPFVRTLRGLTCAAIVSDGPRLSQQRKIEALGVARLFAPIVLTDRWGRAFWKPHGRAFWEIQAATGYSGGECMYVGDNPAKDFEAPRRLGWRTVRVRRLGGEHAAVEAPGAAHSECTSLEELKEVRQ